MSNIKPKIQISKSKTNSNIKIQMFQTVKKRKAVLYLLPLNFEIVLDLGLRFFPEQNIREAHHSL